MIVFITVIASVLLAIVGLVLLISTGKLPKDKKRGRKTAGVVLIILAIVLFFFVNIILPVGDKVDGILLEQYSKKIWIMQLFPLLQGINNKRTN